MERECILTRRSSLALINAYNPGLSGAWMLQRAMSVPAGKERYNRDFINTLLGANFQVGEQLRACACAFKQWVRGTKERNRLGFCYHASRPAKESRPVFAPFNRPWPRRGTPCSSPSSRM